MKKYKGYMTFPLMGADTQQEFRNSVRYDGDFLNPKKRFQIFKRPRRYKVDIVIVGKNNIGTDVTEVTTPKDKLDKAELASLIKTVAVQQLKSLDSSIINLHRSYFKVQVL